MIVAVTLENFRKRKDKSYSITFITTTEGSKELHNELFDLSDSAGILYYKGQDSISKEEKNILDNIDLDLYDKPKTKSQILRGQIFRKWDKAGRIGDFSQYYSHEMDKIINNIREQIEP